MSKITLTLLLVLCIYLASVAAIKSNKMLVCSSSSTLKVPDDYLTIQEAVDHASPGDIIFVRSGTYRENIVIDKSITLMGENRENTIIDGKAQYNVISIRAPNTTITGFTICNSNPSIGCGVFIERPGSVVLHNNKIMSNGVGIQILFSSGNQVHDNLISANYIGIQLIYSSRNIIYRNVISGNSAGMDIHYYSIGNIIHGNTISNNYRSVDISFYSSNNIFYHNNFIKNSYSVYSETYNIWNYGNNGNYWDDYKGRDLNKDGIGDTPYIISERNIDLYPLMGRFNVFDAFLKGEKYSVAIISNSTIFNFAFEDAIKYRTRTILFNTSDIYGSTGFSRVTIPKELMEDIHAVLINDEEVNAIFLNNTDVKNVYLYIEHPGNCSIEIIYSELLDIYNKLLDELSSLNSTYNLLAEKFNLINKTLYNLLADYINLQKELRDINLNYQNQAQNLKGLTYIFAAVSAAFIAATIYLSKVAHNKQGPITKS